MYICEKHGKIDSEWCDDCEEIIECDCKDQTFTRIKDIEYGEKGKTVTIYINHCETCEEFSHIESK